MFQKIAKHRANDASNDVHRPPLVKGRLKLFRKFVRFGRVTRPYVNDDKQMGKIVDFCH